jgi:predicted CXXCH cytochrome family protein
MRIKTFLLSAGAVLLLLALGLAASPVTAAPQPPAAHTSGQHYDAAANSMCLTCHDQDGMSVQLKSGEILPLTINATAFSEGVHGINNIPCVTCHTEISGFPHPDRTTETLRDVKLKYYTSCQQCHSDEFNKTLDSVHQRALASGNKNAAVCADCHNPHTQKPIKDMPRSEIPVICSRCHSAIFNQYKESVHGLALSEGNADVPTCIDCHGVHNITDPTTQAFRLKSPTEMCGKCHTNPAIMDKYGISTQVLNTYVADFHGTTVTIFQKQSPDQVSNKPVCFDCHGIHNIASVKDPQKGLEVKANLLLACQKCHPDATTETYTDAWLSHYIPSQEKYPLVYYINLFYKFLIPGVLGPMGLLVVMDFVRMLINRFRKPQHQASPAHPQAGDHPTDEEIRHD